MTCLTCQKDFVQLGRRWPAGSLFYCSLECGGQSAWRSGPNAYVAAIPRPPCAEATCAKPSRKRGLCCTHYNRQYQPNRSHGPVSIREWTRLNPERVAVQQENKRRRRRARLSEAGSEPYTLAEIAARDRYICQLCRKRVAMTKTVPHPKAPTIDHIRPLVESLDDTRANVQLAHFRCNSLKGARGGAQQLLLFG